jgi:hypothetical protein
MLAAVPGPDVAYHPTGEGVSTVPWRCPSGRGRSALVQHRSETAQFLTQGRQAGFNAVPVDGNAGLLQAFRRFAGCSRADGGRRALQAVSQANGGGGVAGRRGFDQLRPQSGSLLQEEIGEFPPEFQVAAGVS